jgi:iron complex outermembrane recepter protein
MCADQTLSRSSFLLHARPTHVPVAARLRLLRAGLDAIALLLLAAPVVEAADAPSAPASATAGTAIISGRVQSVVTGKFLGNARVAVKGTERAVFTDEEGIYRLPAVPSGPLVLDVSYTGLDTEQISLVALPGQTLTRDVGLTNRARYGASAETLKLDAFVVETSKVTEGEALATNEQRHAANIKNVVSADAFGDVTGGNVAEFLKYLPGLSLDLESGEAISVSVRGISNSMTGVSIDGAQAANSVSTGQSRNFQFKQIALNNASRIELYKVPTPANPADSLGGSVNIVSKSAFERSKAQFNYRVFLTGNGDELTLKKRPFPFDRYDRTVHPGFDFDWTWPVTKNLGIVVTGLRSLHFTPQNLTTQTYSTSGTGTGATPERPYLSSFLVQESPRWTERDTFSARADWRIHRGAVLTLSAQVSYYHDNTRSLRWTFNTGTNGTPTPVAGRPMTYGDTFTEGATGRGSVVMDHLIQNISGVSNGGSARYRFDNGQWNVTAGIHHTFSKTWRRYLERGNFNSVDSTLSAFPIRVTFSDVDRDSPRPGQIQVFDNNNRPVDFYDLNNYRVTTADGPTRGDHWSKVDVFEISVRRNLQRWRMPLAVQLGANERINTRDIQRQNLNWTYNSPDGDRTPLRFVSSAFSSHDNYYGFGHIPWTSPWRAADLWQQNPGMFTKTLAQQVAEERFRIQNSERFKETVDSLYGMVDTRLFRERLRVLTGVRYEHTETKAAGPLVNPSNVFLRTPSGEFVRGPNGARVRDPAAGAAGSLEETRMTYFERANRVSRTYDDFFPSVHLTTNITEALQVRVAYARTYGRPDLGSIIPNATITENDIIANPENPGTINVRNTGLKPWMANNYDLSLEYYTKSGGLFTAGVFRKDITDFFGSVTRVATAEDIEALGLDERYVGFLMTTMFNSGSARVTGAELSAKHSLQPLGGWGKHFILFANATKLELKGNQNASFSSFLPESANWGITFTRRPLTVFAKWTYRGEQRLGAQPTFGTDAWRYWAPRTQMDVNADWRLTNRLTLFFNARNVFNAKPRQIIYGAATPSYAENNVHQEFGVGLTAGIKGTF